MFNQNTIYDAKRSPNPHIVESIAIDIAGTRDRSAGAFTRCSTDTLVCRRKVNLLGAPQARTKNKVDLARLKRVFDVDGLACPLCDQPMRLRAVVLPPATLRVLDRLEQACRGPPQQGAA